MREKGKEKREREEREEVQKERRGRRKLDGCQLFDKREGLLWHKIWSYEFDEISMKPEIKKIIRIYQKKRKRKRERDLKKKTANNSGKSVRTANSE